MILCCYLMIPLLPQLMKDYLHGSMKLAMYPSAGKKHLLLCKAHSNHPSVLLFFCRKYRFFMGILFELMMDWRILCAFVGSSHSMPHWRSSFVAASCRLPSPFAHLLDWRILSAFVGSSHSMPHWCSFFATASCKVPSPCANVSFCWILFLSAYSISFLSRSL